MGIYGNYPNPDLCKKYGCYSQRNNYFMEGCPGCDSTAKRKQELMQTEIQNAENFAKQIKKLVILYYDSEGVPKHMEAEAAKLAGVQPIHYIPHV